MLVRLDAVILNQLWSRGHEVTCLCFRGEPVKGPDRRHVAGCLCGQSGSPRWPCPGEFTFCFFWDLTLVVVLTPVLLLDLQVCGHRFVKLYGPLAIRQMIGRCILRGNDLRYNDTDMNWQNLAQTCR